MNRLKIFMTVIFCFSVILFVGCKSAEQVRKDWKSILPEVIEPEEYDEKLVSAVDVNLPDTSFENATVQDIENYYKRNLRKGAVYFVGYEDRSAVGVVAGDTSSPAPAPVAGVAANPASVERCSFFVTGDIINQLTTVAIKFNGVLYQLNDDFYIVRQGLETLMERYQVSTVFVSSLPSEDLEKLLSLYKITGYTLGLQTVARGSLLDLVDFQTVLKTVNSNKSIYLIDLAFVDLTIEETVFFQAYLKSNSVDLLTVKDFSELFSVFLNCSADNLRSRNYYSQSLLASDGKSSRFDVGVKHSREQRSISDQGTSTISGYDTIEDGIQLSFTPANTIGNKVLCQIQLENSAFSDESYTTKSETTIDVDEIPLELGKTYYLSSLSNLAKSREFSLFGLNWSNSNRSQTCWVRVRRIK